MADYFSHATAKFAVPMSHAELNDLTVLLDTVAEDDEHHGFELSWSDGAGYLFAGERWSVAEEYLSEAFLKRFGEILQIRAIPYLEIGVAFTCSKMRMDSHGGTSFRIMADGSIVHPIEIWPGEETFLVATLVSATPRPRIPEDTPLKPR